MEFIRVVLSIQNGDECVREWEREKRSKTHNKHKKERGTNTGNARERTDGPGNGEQNNVRAYNGKKRGTKRENFSLARSLN